MVHSDRGGLALRLVITGACTARVKNDAGPIAAAAPGRADVERDAADHGVTVSCDGKGKRPFTLGFDRDTDARGRIVTISF